MDVIEAEDLYNWALMEIHPGQMYIYQIGNGEFTLRLRKYDFWCWNRDDFLSYRQAVEDRYAQQPVEVA